MEGRRLTVWSVPRVIFPVRENCVNATQVVQGPKMFRVGVGGVTLQTAHDLAGRAGGRLIDALLTVTVQRRRRRRSDGTLHGRTEGKGGLSFEDKGREGGREGGTPASN